MVKFQMYEWKVRNQVKEVQMIPMLPTAPDFEPSVDIGV